MRPRSLLLPLLALLSSACVLPAAVPSPAPAAAASAPVPAPPASKAAVAPNLWKTYCDRCAKAADTATDQCALGTWCRQMKLDAEATAHLERALALDPANAQVRQLLGFEQIKGQWLRGDELAEAKGLVRWFGKWVQPAQLKQQEDRLTRMRAYAAEHRQWSKAWKLRTTHFDITSNCPGRLVEEMGRSMDLCYQALAAIFAPKGSERIPLEIYATQEEFIQGSALAGFPASPGTLGYFYYYPGIAGPTDMGIRCFYAGSLNQTLSTLFHECTHLVLRRTYSQDLPIWANEGMAVFMEFAKRRETSVDLRSVPWDRLWDLQDQLRQGDFSLDELVSIPYGGGYSGTYYPRGWGLLYWLGFANSGKHVGKLQQYYDLKVRKSAIGDFREIFGFTPEAIYPEWKKEFLAREPKTADELHDASLAMIWYRFDAAKALGYADAALAKAPSDWKAIRSRARVLFSIARLSGRAADYVLACDAFDAALTLRGKRSSKPSMTEQLIDCEHALSALGADRTGLAVDLAAAVVEADDLHAAGYRVLAHIAAVSSDAKVRNLSTAKLYLQIANDLGPGHENDHVAALIAHAEGDTAKAVTLLEAAAELDGFGFGAAFYRREMQRIAPRPPVMPPQPGTGPRPSPPPRPPRPAPPKPPVPPKQP